MNVLAITQARTGSSRLPGKVLMEVEGRKLLDLHLDRIQRSKLIEQLLVATTAEPEDELIAGLAACRNLPFYRGSVSDVLDRFYQAALPLQPQWVVRLTSDCPLIDAALIDAVIEQAMDTGVDYCSNTLAPSYPDGMDIEVFTFAALEKAWKEATSKSDREHVTPYIHQNSSYYGKGLFRSVNVANSENDADVRLTVDEASDLEVIRLLAKELGTERDWKAYADYYRNNNLVKGINSHIQRNEGYYKSLKDDTH